MKKTNAMRILDRHNVAYIEAPYSYDPEQLGVSTIAAALGLPVGQVYKTLVATGDKTGVLVAVIPGDKELDFKLLSQYSCNKKISLVPLKDLQSLTGYIRGGCSPVGMKKNYPVWFDESALSWDRIYINAGQRGMLIGVAPQEVIRVTQAGVGEIC
ncbi:MAG: Cys-tRNA(Pro) deacylase [Saprospiraceae bacterium]|nr:Cys-tRNA(Pro) deacylase [Saprospiraceae bacterium]